MYGDIVRRQCGGGGGIGYGLSGLGLGRKCGSVCVCRTDHKCIRQLRPLPPSDMKERWREGSGSPLSEEGWRMEWVVLLFTFLYPSSLPVYDRQALSPHPLHPALPLSYLWKPCILLISGQRRSQNWTPAHDQAPFINSSPTPRLSPESAQKASPPHTTL